MEIKRMKSLLVIVWLWILVALINLITISLMFPSIFMFLPITVEFFAILDAVIYYRLYKEPIIIQDNKISFYGGWLLGRKEYVLSEVTSVKYTKNVMVFYIAGAKRALDLGFICKEDEIYIYQYLKDNNISIQF